MKWFWGAPISWRMVWIWRNNMAKGTVSKHPSIRVARGSAIRWSEGFSLRSWSSLTMGTVRTKFREKRMLRNMGRSFSTFALVMRRSTCVPKGFRVLARKYRLHLDKHALCMGQLYKFHSWISSPKSCSTLLNTCSAGGIRRNCAYSRY